MSSQLRNDEVGVVDEPPDTASVDDAVVIDLREPRLVIDPPLRRGKRVAELAIALVLAIITIPLQIVCLALSAISFRATPVFSQDRVGYLGETFRFRKIRSLPVTAPSEAEKGVIAGVANTWVGRFLRKSHFDELIQLWSVVTGQLSLIGPRPEMVRLSSTYPDDFVRIRTSVRPGVTGLWQVSAGAQGLIGETPEYDLFYVEASSWRLDAWIGFRTILKILGNRTVQLTDVPVWVRRDRQE